MYTKDHRSIIVLFYWEVDGTVCASAHADSYKIRKFWEHRPNGVLMDWVCLKNVEDESMVGIVNKLLSQEIKVPHE